MLHTLRITLYLPCNKLNAKLYFSPVDENSEKDTMELKSMLGDLVDVDSSMVDMLNSDDKQVFTQEKLSKIFLEESQFNNETPLYMACINKDIESVRLLLKAGAQVDQGFKGDSPLHLALQDKSEDIAVLLIEKGANLEYPSMDMPALFYAINHNLAKVVAAILKRDSSLSQRVKGETAIEVAKRLNDQSVLDVFRKFKPSLFDAPKPATTKPVQLPQSMHRPKIQTPVIKFQRFPLPVYIPEPAPVPVVILQPKEEVKTAASEESQTIDDSMELDESLSISEEPTQNTLVQRHHYERMHFESDKFKSTWQEGRKLGLQRDKGIILISRR